MTFKKFVFFLTLIAVLVFAFFYRSNGSAKSHTVVLGENGFEPKEITIEKGDLVVFSTTTGSPFWPASNLHPLHDIYPEFDPKKPVDANATWSFRFTKIGEWEYHNHLFPTHRGKIRVLAKEAAVSREALRKNLRNDIEKLGVEIAYQKLKDNFAKETFSLQHLSVHFFGELLFEELGIKGITLCDDTFAFGCYHGFFTSAIAKEGLLVVSELDKICVEKFGLMGLGCPHGIGHGLAEFFGPEKLNEQLAVCETLSWKGPLFGCSGGVFMAHNFPVEVSQKEAVPKVRELKEGATLEPCLTVPKKFRRACFFELTSWWRQVLDKDYLSMGKLCDRLSDSKEKKDCFRGIGSSSAEASEYSLEEVVFACDLMPDASSETFCRAGGSWAFFANPLRRDLSGKLCQDLGTRKTECMQISNLVVETDGL